MNHMHVLFNRLLQIPNFNQPGHSGRWSSFNGWLYMVSYLMICMACLIIPVVIGRYLFRKQVNPYYRRIYILFGAFIFTTGATFFLDALSVWIPIYTIKAIASLITGIVSVITLFYLFKFLPRAFSLRVSKKRESYKNEERFRLLVEEVKDYAIMMVDLEGRVGTWNKGAEAISGYTANEIIGSPIAVFYSEEDIAKGEPANNLKAARELGRFVNETRRIRKDGSVFWANCVVTALYDDRGELYGYSTVTRDVTERKRLQDGINLLNQDLEKRIEEKTKEVITSEKRFRALVEHSHDAISLFNEKMEVIYRSPVALRIRGKVAPNLSVMESIHPEDRDAVKKMFQEAIENPGKPIPMFFRTIDINGGFLYADGALINLLHDESVKAFVTNLRDVTEKKRVEEDLRKTFNELSDYKDALDKATIVSITDPDGFIKHVNDNFCKISKYSREELVGEHHSKIRSGFYTPEETARIYHIINTEKIWKGEVQHKAKDGSLYWEDATVMPFVDIDGNVYQYISIKNDITALKNVTKELHDLNSQLEYRVEQRTQELNEANKALESFSYSVSHDLRAPLRIIDGYSDILLEDHSDQLDKEGKRILDIIMNNARRMGKLIDALLNLSRLGRKELSMKPINMNNLLNKVINDQPFPSNSPVDIRIADLLPATGDAELLEHVWGNLISNAVKYSSKTASPVVEINSEKNGQEVIYSVKDNGVGFDMKYSDKLFGVFQRLHKMNEYEGTGIGLALVQRIVTKNSGRVWVESEPGKGATFYFTLKT